MKKLLLSMSLAMCFGAISQTTVYSEDFTTGSTWTLNTILGAEGAWANVWYISCQEDGQAAGVCGTACTISDNSLHISTNGALFGDLGAAYFEGLGCNTNRRAESGNINTIGESTLTLSFDMIGAANAQDYTELFYSINGGSTWVSLATPLTSLCCGGVACTGSLQGLWQNNIYALPATCENISNLRIAFVWRNLDDGAATDPSFAVDDILITSASSPSSSITTTNDVAPASWCTGTTVSGTVNFVATGTFNAANVYSAELSDATGAFGSPTVVGTLASAASGNLSITTAIPGGIPTGTGYRIRVVASDPSTTGTNNGSDLVSNPLPIVTLGTLSDVCVNHAASALTGGMPANGTYSGAGVSAGMFDPGVAGVGTHTITYSLTDGNGCSNSTTQDIVVDACLGLSGIYSTPITVYPNPTNETFIISTEGIISEVQLLDMSGRVVKLFEGNNELYDVKEINAGVYILRINNDSVIQTIRLAIK